MLCMVSFYYIKNHIYDDFLLIENVKCFALILINHIRLNFI